MPQYVARADEVVALLADAYARARSAEAPRSNDAQFTPGPRLRSALRSAGNAGFFEPFARRTP